MHCFAARIMATACISQLRQMPLHCTPALAGFVCAAVLSPALVHGNRLHPQQVAFYAVSLELHPTPYRSALPGAALRPSGSICTTCRIARCQSTRSSPHSRPAVTLAAACILSQLQLSTCPAPHSSPGGLHLRSNAFAQQRNSQLSLPVALVQQVNDSGDQSSGYGASCRE